MCPSTRRRVLASSSAALLALAGCTAVGSDGDGTGGESKASAAENWPLPRGTAAATGASASGGPTADATPEFTAELRDGVRPTTPRYPMVGEDAVYAVGRAASPYDHDPPQFAQYAYALSREDGSELWRRTLASGEGEDAFRLAGPMHACLGPDGLYVTRLDRQDDDYTWYVSRLSLTDGSRQWRERFPDLTGGFQPVVADGRVYLTRYGRLVALSAADGSVQCRTDQYDWSHRRPTVGEDAVAMVHDGRLDGEESDGGGTEDDHEWTTLAVFERSDGSERWSFDVGQAVGSSPTIAGDAVFVPEGDIGNVAYGGPSGVPPRRIRAFDLADGDERWQHTYDNEETNDGHHAGGTRWVAVDDGSVYFALGFQIPRPNNISESQWERVKEELYRGPSVFALDRATGDVRWSQRLGEIPRVFSPLLIDEERVYTVRSPGLVEPDRDPACHVLDKESGDVLGTFGRGALADGPLTSATLGLADGTLYSHRGGSVLGFR